MKLIIKEYLATLKERDELDAILPDLLSEIGLNVFTRPNRGSRQSGVDVGANGCMDGKDEMVYLFAIKSGDLDRDSWNGKSVQALRPSIEEIIDAYIPTRLPLEHKEKPIVICLCFGGVIKETVRLEVEGYQENISKKYGIKFEEWNGDKLANLILTNFLREELLPKKFQSYLRKSLSLLDEPEASYKHFINIVKMILRSDVKKDKEIATALRQLNICLWILFSWCREANNLEAAFLSSEFSVLYAWETTKSFLTQKTQISSQVISSFESILQVYQLICTQFLEVKIFPHVDKLFALSNAVRPSCEVDVNLKLFDVLGRIAISGIWNYWNLQKSIKNNNSDQSHVLKSKLQLYFNSIKQLIINNPILFSPYKDDQAIEIALATWFLALDSRNHKFIHDWLSELILRVFFNFKRYNKYPCIFRSYSQLIKHPESNLEEYRMEATSASILYPTIAAFSALLGFEDIYKEIQNKKEELLKHCNFQFWYPDEISETFFYTNSSMHGAALSHLFIEKSKEEFLNQIFKECKENHFFEEMSANKYGIFPIVLLGCRHFRLPIPVHFIKILKDGS